MFDDIFEFRTNINAGREIRIFYFRTGDTIQLLNGFVKKTKSTPESEKMIAKSLRKKFL
jgi:phage-related protein